MTTAIELKSTTSYDRAIAKAQELQPKVVRVIDDENPTPYTFEVESTSRPGVWYDVELEPGGFMDFAACNCACGRHYERGAYCKHQAAAYLSFQRWLERPQGQEFKAAWRRGDLTADIGGHVLQIRPRHRVEPPHSTPEELAKDYADLFGDL